MKAIKGNDESTDQGSSTESAVAMTDPPIVLDLGVRDKKQVKRLRRGDGKLMDRINIVMEELRKGGKISSEAQPVLLIVRERREKGLSALFKS